MRRSLSARFALPLGRFALVGVRAGYSTHSQIDSAAFATLRIPIFADAAAIQLTGLGGLAKTDPYAAAQAGVWLAWKPHLGIHLDVGATTALSEAQRRRVLAKAGPVLRAVAQDERSQLRNRELAVERLVEGLREALRVERRRVPTKPTAAARESRLEGKKRRAETKRLRRDPLG